MFADVINCSQEEGGDISQHQKRDEDDDGSGTGHDAFDYGDSRPQLAAMTVIPLHERVSECLFAF